uniref:Uncharacterized protein n=1 Tax=Caulobacter phage BL57 TaxID=3348355 RepID=A0AB74UIF3_9VIRU
MATPRNFAGANKTWNPAPGNEDTVAPLHTYTGPEGVISCWELTPAERAVVAETGLIWLQQPRRDLFVPQYVSGLPLMEHRTEDGILMKYDPDLGLEKEQP